MDCVLLLQQRLQDQSGCLWLLDEYLEERGPVGLVAVRRRRDRKIESAEGSQGQGVDPDRLVFARRVASSSEHLGRHRLADLFLDTLPYNAHTTASDALWAGLPVLTCTGDTFAGRVAGSLLRAAGLGELITTSLEEYEALA